MVTARLNGVDQFFSIVVSIIGALFVGWALIVQPAFSDKPSDSGNHLGGILLLLAIVALIAAVIFFVLPFIAPILIWALVIAVIAAAVFFLVKFLRPHFPRIIRVFRKFLSHAFHVILRVINIVVRTLAHVLRPALDWLSGLLRRAEEWTISRAQKA